MECTGDQAQAYYFTPESPKFQTIEETCYIFQGHIANLFGLLMASFNKVLEIANANSRNKGAKSQFGMSDGRLRFFDGYRYSVAAPNANET